MIIPKMNLNDAIIAGDFDAVRAAIRNGANVNRRDLRDQTPIFYACYPGYLEILMLLMEHGANPNVKDMDGTTPIMHASDNQAHEIVQYLIQHGAQ